MGETQGHNFIGHDWRVRVMLLLVLLTGLFLIPRDVEAGSESELDFTLHKLDSGKPGNTLLVVGGIQGDEPGGFNAASLLVSHYTIETGQVWVVPNLNFISIIRQSRGVHGDMNRKFASLATNDPEYETVSKIKSILLDPQVDVILNMHDGSGFYRPEYVDSTHNPLRWGQSIIIDQEEVENLRFGYLGPIARRVAGLVNEGLYHERHRYHVKDTRTRDGDMEMAKTLTFFAICNGKAAFGLEASKDFSTNLRGYYHLRAVEAFMDLLGIKHTRHFPMTAEGVKGAIEDNVTLAFYDHRILLDLRNPRARLGYFPLKKDSSLNVTPNRPILAVVDAGKEYRVYYGNRRLTRLAPQYFEYDESLAGVPMVVDGECRDVHFGAIVKVRDAFQVMPVDGCRVNVIGFTAKEDNEAGLLIRHQDIPRRFSVDEEGELFRVEVYRGEKFSGMVLVDFSEHDHLLSSASESLSDGMPLDGLEPESSSRLSR